MAILRDVQRIARELGFDLREDNSNFLLISPERDYPNCSSHSLELILCYLQNIRTVIQRRRDERLRRMLLGL